MAFITSRHSPKWHRFQKNFLETVLILIVCLLFVLDHRGSVLKREQKEAVSRSREDFPSVDPFQHRDVLSKKKNSRRILSIPAHSEILNRFLVEMYLVFPP